MCRALPESTGMIVLDSRWKSADESSAFKKTKHPIANIATIAMLRINLPWDEKGRFFSIPEESRVMWKEFLYRYLTDDGLPFIIMRYIFPSMILLKIE
jgi:hypothetical protein